VATEEPQALEPFDVRITLSGAFNDVGQAAAVIAALRINRDEYDALIRMHGEVHDHLAISGDTWTAEDRDTPELILAARIVQLCVKLEVDRARRAWEDAQAS
jgi:hypothetical protein